jgi:hypothetical protein
MDPLQDVPQDVRTVAARLRDERPELTPLELDDVQRRLVARAARSRRSGFVRSRLSVTAVLVFGLLFSTAGVGLAVSGSSGTGNAASAQYPSPSPKPQVEANVTSNTPTTPAQPIRQTQAVTSGSSLPFTGLAAIPILVGGLLLLTLGLVLRRTARRQT